MFRVDVPPHGQEAGYVSQTQAAFNLSPPAVASILIAYDLMVCIGSLAAADLIYHHVFLDGRYLPDTFIMAGLAAIVIVAIIAIRDGYNVETLADRRFQLRVTLEGWFFGFFVVGWIAFLSKATAEFSRIGVTSGFIAGLAILLMTRSSLIDFLFQLVNNGSLKLRSAYVIFTISPAEQQRRLEQLEKAGTTLSGMALLPLTGLAEPAISAQMESIIAEIRNALSTKHCDAIYLFFSWSRPDVIGEFKRRLIRLPLPVYLFANDEYDQIVSGRGMRVSTMPAFEIQRAPLSLFERALKRSFDVCIALGLLVALSPLITFISLATFISSGGPVIFHQARKGFAGRKFEILKFRTMCVCENGDKIVQATRGDARVTSLGRMLRRTSIDELPQLWNIVHGEMSLVGPRPHAVAHDNQYDDLIASYANRHHMKPGLTGWAQIHGHRGETPDVASMQARVTHDLWYIDNWSIWLDIRILFRTVFTVPFDGKAH